jgi:hypothetical protein
MNEYWVVEVYLQAFLTSALDEGEWSASLLAGLPPFILNKIILDSKYI